MHMTAKTRHGWKKMTSPVALLVVFNGRQVRVPDLLLFMLGQRMGGCLTVRNIQTYVIAMYYVCQVRVPDLLFFMLGQRMGGCLTVLWCSSRQKPQVSNIERILLKINVLFNNYRRLS